MSTLLAWTSLRSCWNICATCMICRCVFEIPTMPHESHPFLPLKRTLKSTMDLIILTPLSGSFGNYLFDRHMQYSSLILGLEKTDPARCIFFHITSMKLVTPNTWNLVFNGKDVTNNSSLRMTAHRPFRTPEMAPGWLLVDIISKGFKIKGD